MAGTDSTFSAYGSEQSNTARGTVSMKDQGNAGLGNPQGDRVVNTEGENKLIEDGFFGTFQQSTRLTNSIQYNPASLYPNS